MTKPGIGIILFAAILATGALADPGDLSVEDALAYAVPETTCTFEAPRRSGDPTTQARNEKKAAKKWRRCMRGYHESLVADVQRLKSVAADGLTEAQAQVILGHMAAIHQTLQGQTGESGNQQEELPWDTTGFWDRAHGR